MRGGRERGWGRGWGRGWERGWEKQARGAGGRVKREAGREAEGEAKIKTE